MTPRATSPASRTWGWRTSGCSRILRCRSSNVAELIAYAKKNPGKLSYATPGVGTGTHLAGEMLNHMAGIDMVHVPYKGSAPAQQDVIGGRVPLLFDVLYLVDAVREGRAHEGAGAVEPEARGGEPGDTTDRRERSRASRR